MPLCETSLEARLYDETRRCSAPIGPNTEEQDAQVRVVQSVLNGIELRANQVAAAERDSRLDTIKAECKRLKAERFEVLESIQRGLAKYLFKPTAQELTRSLI